jgi:hypothetical protein
VKLVICGQRGAPDKQRDRPVSASLDGPQYTVKAYFTLLVNILPRFLEKSNASHPEDGAWGNSEVGRKCKALMESVIYGKRALPIAWIVVQGNKGHYPEEIHSRVWCLLSEAAPKQAAYRRLL